MYGNIWRNCLAVGLAAGLPVGFTTLALGNETLYPFVPLGAILLWVGCVGLVVSYEGRISLLQKKIQDADELNRQVKAAQLSSLAQEREVAKESEMHFKGSLEVLEQQLAHHDELLTGQLRLMQRIAEIQPGLEAQLKVLVQSTDAAVGRFGAKLKDAREKAQENLVDATAISQQFSGKVVSGSSSDASSVANLMTRSVQLLNEASIMLDESLKLNHEHSHTVSEMLHHMTTLNLVAEDFGHLADQSNILALNAAIEVARAAEHNRGFDVLAGEVKKLSERAGQASDELNKTIREMDALGRKVSASLTDHLVGTTVKKQTIESAAQALLTKVNLVSNVFTKLVNVSVSTAQNLVQQLEQTSNQQDVQDLTRQSVEVTLAMSQQISALVEDGLVRFDKSSNPMKVPSTKNQEPIDNVRSLHGQTAKHPTSEVTKMVAGDIFLF